MKITSLLLPIASGLAGTTSATSGPNIPPPDLNLTLNPVIENYIRDLHDTPFSRELLAAASDNNNNSTIPCSSPGSIWSTGQILQMGQFLYSILVQYSILDMPFIYKVFIDQSEEGEYFGVDGNQTEELLQRQQMTEAFWEEADVNGIISTDDVVLMGAHGAMLEDYEKMVPTIEFMYPFLDAETVDNFFDYIQAVISFLPSGSANPLLTANAIAVAKGDGNPGAIVVGDGIIERLISVGLGENGPDFVHAHEFAHQLQFKQALISFITSSPEATRRTELMADALSSYFLSHDEGANMTTDQILELHKTAFSVGDCNIDSDGHHGTPSQRRCASMWGASQATVTTAGRQREFLRGRKLQNTYLIDPATFVEKFDDALDDILSLSSEVCPLLSNDDVINVCPDGMVPITLIIQLDQFSDETSWSIKGETDDINISKQYSSDNIYELVLEIECVYPDGVYVFDLFDSFGDGIFGGYYKIFNGTTTSNADALLIKGDEITGDGTNATFTLIKMAEPSNGSMQNMTNQTDPETEPPQNTTNTTEPEPKPSQNSTNTTEPAPEPPQNTTNSTDTDTEPPHNTTNTTEPESKPLQNTTNNTDADPEPSQNTTNTTEPEPEPEPSQNTTNTTEPETQSSQNTTNTTKPESSQNTTNTTEPEPEPSQNTTNTADTEPEPLQNTTNTTDTEPDPSQNTTHTTEPETQPSQNTTNSTEPETEPSQNTTNSTEPETEPPQNTTNTTKP